MAGQISNDLLARHERLVERLRDKLFGQRTLNQYRFQSCDVIPPVNGFVWENLGGLRLSYTNKHGVRVDFEVQHDTEALFTIFILQKDPSFTFGNRSCHFRSLDTRLLELANEYWEKDAIIMGLGK